VTPTADYIYIPAQKSHKRLLILTSAVHGVEGYHIDWGDDDDFYTVTGDFATYVGSTVPEKDYLAMTFEFGTLYTQTTMGSIKALHTVMIKNQGVQR
jgi:hypothetical protein